MLNLYNENTANFPRLKTDKFFIDYKNDFKFNEITDKTMKFTEDYQLLKTDLWYNFAEQFSEQTDGDDDGWRGGHGVRRHGCD